MLGEVERGVSTHPRLSCHSPLQCKQTALACNRAWVFLKLYLASVTLYCRCVQ